MADEVKKNVSEMSHEELLAYVARLENKGTTGGLKVAPSGGVSCYGLGRFPVTLYASQWAKLIEKVKSGEVERFIETNKDKLKFKAE